ncbi:C-type lectin LmsL-like [Rhineura floridana]|uniref:C-type lectin LmsL-like n=1 Tax=Rhineura floridana TaxID=261503 RepID=UPI002AC88540|nr:C-type lectin LmsL-like [Rhineura floridana]
MRPVSYFRRYLFGLLVSGFFLQGTEAGKCPAQWMQSQGKCYGIFTKELAWPEAEVECHRLGLGGHLASFLSAPENAAVAKYIIANHPGVRGVWIGLHDAQNASRWRWTDSSTSNFKPWISEKPSAKPGGKLCVFMPVKAGFMKWEEEDCEAKMPYACKSVL